MRLSICNFLFFRISIGILRILETVLMMDRKLQYEIFLFIRISLSFCLKAIETREPGELGKFEKKECSMLISMSCKKVVYRMNFFAVAEAIEGFGD